MPEISVIIPVYNSEKTISKCLLSLVRQKNFHIEYEIIIVNDGSTDNSESVILKFASEYKNIKYYRKENGGVSSARNTGLSLAEGKYITFVDSDDEVSRNYISVLEKNLGHDIVIFSFIVCRSTEKNSGQIYRVRNNADIEAIYKNNLLNSPWNKLYKKEICKNFCGRMAMGEDLMFNISVFSETEDYIYIDSVLYKYNIIDGSAMNGYKRKYIYDYIKLFPHMKKFCKSHNISDEVLIGKYAACINHQIVMLSLQKNIDFKEEISRIWKALDKNNMLDIKTYNIRFLLFRYKYFDVLKITYPVLYKFRDFIRQVKIL